MFSEKDSSSNDGWVVICEAVDGSVTDDARDHIRWEVDFLWSACHEVAQQIPDARSGVVFGEEEVREVIQFGSWQPESGGWERETRRLVVIGSMRQAAGYARIRLARWRI